MSNESAHESISSQPDQIITEEENIFREVERILPSIVAPETALPAIRFALFNFLIVNQDKSAEEYGKLLDREIAKLSALGAKEEKYKSNDKIPSVGIELEFPDEGLNDSNIDIDKLEDLGIHSGPETNHPELWELRTSPSFSTSTQSKIIEEARKSNIIGAEENLSLHVNLGVPVDINERKQDVIYSTSSTDVFVNSATLAFTSVERLEKRKTLGVYTVKNTSIENVGTNNVFRLELRTHEFNDSLVYRALSEIQLVAASYFEYIRSLNKKEYQKELTEVWYDLCQKYKDVCNKYRLPSEELTAFDTDYKNTIKVLSAHPEIRSEMRSIYTESSTKIKKILKLG